jgi:HK97 family phage major capsid protein
MAETIERAAAIDASDDETRCVTSIISAEDVALDNHIIITAGIDTTDYMNNPVVLFAHNQASPPIARMLSVWKRGTQLLGKVQFADENTYPFADTIYKLIRGGYLNAMSISWFPLKYERANDRSRPDGLNFLSCKLLECSIVPVPALPNALLTARAAGIDLSPLDEWSRKLSLKGRNATMRAQARAILNELKRPFPPTVAAPPPAPAIGPSITELDARSNRRAAARARNGEWGNFGEWAQSLIATARNGGLVNDPRLVRAPTGAGEVDPTGGGFLVPKGFADQLVESVYSESVVAAMCDRQRRENGRPVKRPMIDETSRADGARWGGVKVFWSDEGEAISPSFPRLKLAEFSPHSLLGYCIVSNELAADAPMLENYLRKAFASELSFNLDREIIGPTVGGVTYGTGAGRPLGILNSPALIVEAKVGSQASGTIVADNIGAMWGRMPAPCRLRAVWLASEDAMAALDLQANNLTWAGIWAPPSQGERFPRLKGAPVLEVEQAPPVGITGDIILLDLSQYLLIENWTIAVSAEALFTSDQTIFRFKLRVDGKPAWTSPITAWNGTQTRSPFVALAPR